MGLWLNAVPPADLQAVLDNLVNDITVTHSVHPTTGILGWKFMLETLTTNGRSDVGVLVNLQKTYPSLGYMIEGVGNYEPATTIWELWDSDVEGPGMNSRNHIMFGSVGGWFYKSFLGLYPASSNRTKFSELGDGTGFNYFFVGPDASIVNVYNTTSASGSTTTPNGMLEVAWHVAGAGSTCGMGDEGSVVTFACGPNNPIKDFTFVSYGTPIGSCQSGFKKGSCDLASAAALVAKTCVGKTSCQIPVSNDFFGQDPCFGTRKNFDAAMVCTTTPQMYFELTIVIPFGSTAAVNVPIVPSIHQTKANIEISEGGKVVWQNQKYIPGAPGISSGMFNAQGTGVTVVASAGKYTFVATASN